MRERQITVDQVYASPVNAGVKRRKVISLSPGGMVVYVLVNEWGTPGQEYKKITRKAFARWAASNITPAIMKAREQMAEALSAR